jgi:hypothetical protein
MHGIVDQPATTFESLTYRRGKMVMAQFWIDQLRVMVATNSDALAMTPRSIREAISSISESALTLAKES